MTTNADRDQLSRFLIEGAGVRGVRVHLEDTWQQIRTRAEYPAAAAELLGEALAKQLRSRGADTLLKLT